VYELCEYDLCEYDLHEFDLCECDPLSTTVVSATFVSTVKPGNLIIAGKDRQGVEKNLRGLLGIFV